MIFSRAAFAKLEDLSPKWIDTKSDLPVKRQCELLGINRSTYYYKPVEASEEYIEEEEHIMACIDEINTNYPWAGQRRIKALLKRQYDIDIGRKRIRRLMAEMGICAIYPKPNLSKRNFKEAIVPYLLRNMNIFMPNQVWAIDITYIKMNHSHMYLTAVIDWYSRKVVGWNLSDSLDTSEAIIALENAIEKHGVPGIVNSDQGSTFTSKEFKDVLKRHGIRQSMDGKSRWADNVIIERWFRSLKSEKIYPEEFYSPRHLRTEIKKYIEEYNSIRPHQAHEYNAPDDVYHDIFENEIKPDTIQAA